MNEHTYPVTDEFQSWWATVCNKPWRAFYEKLMAWKAWELQDEKIKKLKEALRFYAEQKNYEFNKEDQANYVWNDQGLRAREALGEDNVEADNT